jgi:hypothetical protein
MDFQLINVLDWLREIFGVPFIVRSGFRCVEHNRKVGGASKSFHTTGKAADITVARKNLLPLIYRIAIVSKRFNGIGLASSFIHFDTGNRPTPYYFVYLSTTLPNGRNYKQLNPDFLAKIQSETIEEHLREYKV